LKLFEKDWLITVQYPEERSPPENYRNFPFLMTPMIRGGLALCGVQNM
jgi:hypothetical protein